MDWNELFKYNDDNLIMEMLKGRNRTAKQDLWVQRWTIVKMWLGIIKRDKYVFQCAIEWCYLLEDFIERHKHKKWLF